MSHPTPPDSSLPGDRKIHAPWLRMWWLRHVAPTLARLAVFYNWLCSLPRHLRRRLQRPARLSLSGVALALALNGFILPSAPSTVAALTGNIVVDMSAAGLDDTDNLCSLAEAIINANNGNDTSHPDCTGATAGANTIELQPPVGDPTLDTYYATDDLGPYAGDGYTALPAITSEITIAGNGHTIQRDSQDPFRLFYVEGPDGHLTLNDTTIRGGSVQGYGGGILVDSEATLTVQGSTLEGNDAYYGGAISSRGGTIVVSNSSTIRDNFAYYDGGGIFAGQGTTLTVQDSTIEVNEAYDGDGGGIAARGGTVEVSNSTLTGNYAYNDGGAIAVNNGTLTIEQGSYIDLNEAYDDGGAIQAEFSAVSIQDSRVAGNYSEDQGGGIFAESGSLDIYNSTISGNYAYYSGGGIHVEDDANVTIAQSDITYNSAGFSGPVPRQFSDLPDHIRERLGDGEAWHLDDRREWPFRVPGSEMWESRRSGERGSGGFPCSPGGPYGPMGTGGGIYVDDPATVEIEYSNIYRNFSLGGGGILSELNTSVSISHSAIYENAGICWGGGIATISPNYADSGGMYSSLTELSIEQSTLSGNFTFFMGGAIGAFSYGDSSDGSIDATHEIRILDSTVHNNTSYVLGGAISAIALGATHDHTYPYDDSTATVDVTLSVSIENSTLTGNSALMGVGGALTVMSYYYTHYTDPASVNVSALISLSDSTVSGNSTAYAGGGIMVSTYYYDGCGCRPGSPGRAPTAGATAQVELVRSILSGNDATYTYYDGDSGMDVSVDGYGAEVAVYDGTIIADNYNVLGDDAHTTAQAFYNFTPPAGSDFIATSDGGNPTPLSAILETDSYGAPDVKDNGGPTIGSPTQNGPTLTVALVTGSPALDIAPTGPSADQRGYGRPETPAGRYDAGAYEYGAVPLAVTLGSFEARAENDHILLAWRTKSEIGNLGFNLLRNESPDASGAVRLNEEVIPSEAPGSGQGFAYEWEDGEVEEGVTYYYWLEAVSTTGETTRHGPVSAMLPAPTAITLDSFEAAPSPALPGALVALVFSVMMLRWRIRRARDGVRAWLRGAWLESERFRRL